MYSKVLCETLRGINGVLTYVEADSSNGLPNFLMVGNLASSVKEAGDRVRTALKNSNLEIPAKKVTINIVSHLNNINSSKLSESSPIKTNFSSKTISLILFPT